MERKILDIIIPAYNAKDTLPRCLCSIGMQTLAPNILVTIVNDKSEDGSYQYLIDKYKDILDIQEIMLDENSGPGIARQVGLDKTDNRYIMFLDADDTLTNAFGLHFMIKGLQDKRACACYGDFFVETEEGGLEPYNKRNMGLHGKIYARGFLKQYNIHFNNKRLYEDSFFQSCVEFYSQKLDLPILTFEEKIMIYHYTPTGLCRSIPDEKYSFVMIKSWTENVQEVIGELEKSKLVDVEDFKLACLVELFMDYNYTYRNNDKYINDILDIQREFYKSIYKQKPNANDCMEIYGFICKNDATTLVGGDDIKMIVPPVMSFEEYIDMLGEE